MSYTLFENYWKCPIWILAFSTNFCPIKTDLSGNTVWPQIFKNSPKWTKIELFSDFIEMLVYYSKLTVCFFFLQILSPEWNSIPVFTLCLFGCIWFQDSTQQELTIFFLLTMLSQATTIHLYLQASFDHLLSHTVIRYYSILTPSKIEESKKGQRKDSPKNTSYSAHFLSPDNLITLVNYRVF